MLYPGGMGSSPNLVFALVGLSGLFSELRFFIITDVIACRVVSTVRPWYCELRFLRLHVCVQALSYLENDYPEPATENRYSKYSKEITR